jgi:TctA family transporter
VILGLGESIRAMFPTDFYGTPLSSIPLMERLNSYADFPLVINLSGSAIADYYIRIAATRYHRTLILGCTAVMATDYYPYLSSGQLAGLAGGMKGAAEYERLAGIMGDARRGMDAQSMVHVLIVALVILGNVALLTTGALRSGGSARTTGDPGER